jgi:type VI secretion system protein ImpF
MAELTPQERLQPALLDRLVDDEPHNKTKEPRERRVLNKQRLRQAVLRDLAWLFNATNLGADGDLASHREVARSVVNFGLPALSGQTASALDIVDLERLIRQAILDFEPRILPETLEVEPIVAEAQLDHHNVVSIQIRGTLWAQPVPLELLLRTDVDLESGEVEIRDLTRSG